MTNQKAGTAVAIVEPPRAVAVLRPTEIAPMNGSDIEMMRVIASTVIKSDGMVPNNVKTEEQALAIMFAGHEIGLPPMTSLRQVFVVNGKTDFTTQIYMGLTYAGDETAQFIWYRYDSEGCDVELRRHGRTVHRASYTKEDATLSGQLTPKTRKEYAAGAWEKDSNNKWRLKRGAVPISEEAIDGPWQLYPRDMYAWAAIKRVCRFGAPDLINRIPRFSARETLEVENPSPWLLDEHGLARAEGDEGDVPPFVKALVSSGTAVEVDQVTGEIVATSTDPDPQPPEGALEEEDPGPAEDGSQSAFPAETSDGEEATAALGVEAPAAEAGDPDSQAAWAALQASRSANKEKQALVLELWKQFPETRGERGELQLWAVADQQALTDWIKAQR